MIQEQNLINQVRLVVALFFEKKNQLPTSFIAQFEAKNSKIACFTHVFGPITGIFGWKVYHIYLKFQYLDELREFVTTKSKSIRRPYYMYIFWVSIVVF